MSHSLSQKASILDHTLHPFENLAIILYNPSNPRTYDALFFKVMRSQVIDIQIIEEFSKIELEPDESTDFIRLTRKEVGGDADDDYLQSIIRDDPYRIIHFSIGVAPEDKLDTRVLVRYAGQDFKIFFVNEGFGISNKPDYITPRTSPFSDPKVSAEHLLWKGVNIMVNIINKNKEKIRPGIRILGAVYEVIPIKSENARRMMLKRKIPCRFECVAGVASIRPPVPNEWGKPMHIDENLIEEVMQIG